MDQHDEPTTIHVAPSGDFRLHVQQDSQPDNAGPVRVSTTDATKSYIVSSTVMSFASPVWKVLFDPQGQFMEATAKEAYLLDDDPDMLLVLLRISHLQFHELPTGLSFTQLLNMAILCDKYDTVRIVRPWIRQWQKPLEHLALTSGYEEWLFIAWTFGDFDTFEKLAKQLAKSCLTNQFGHCITPTGKRLDGTMPPGIVGK